MTIEDVEREQRAQADRRERARIERDLLIQEVQKNPDMSPSDKDHFRDALNATYAAANGSIDRIADLATSNVLWARIHVRSFVTDARVERHLKKIESMLTAEPAHPTWAWLLVKARVCIVILALGVVAIVSFALVIRPELGQVVEKIAERALVSP